MLLPTLLSTSALALTATAFLVPPEVSKDALDSKKIGESPPLPQVIDPASQSVKLDCSTCPFALNSTRNGAHEWVNGIKSDLELKFTTEDKVLKLNGAPIYPTPNVKEMVPIKAKQIFKEGPDGYADKAFDGPLGLSYSLEVQEMKAFAGDVTLIPVVISIAGLENELVNLRSVEVRAIKQSDGHLMISSIVTGPTLITPDGLRCSTVLCRLMSMIRAKIALAKAKAQAASHKVKHACMRVKNACMRTMGFKPHKNHSFPNVPKPNHNGDAALPGTGGHPIPTPQDGSTMPTGHPHHHHKGHGHHSAFHNLTHATMRVFKHVALPILIGVAAGMAATAVGMLIGQMIILLCDRYPRKQAAQRAQAGVIYLPVESEEKDVFVDDEAGLPAYEDLEGNVIEARDEKD